MAYSSSISSTTVLIEGGCGYLGAELVKGFCADPAFTSTHVMSRNPTKNLHPKAQYHAGDILNTSDVTTIFEKVKPDIIIHCAAAALEMLTKVHWNTNVTGTEVLLKRAASTPSIKVFVATSSEVIGSPPDKKPIKEEVRIYDIDSKINLYCITKALAEKVVLAANDPPNLVMTALRMPILYSGDDEKQIGNVLRGIAKGQHKVQA